MDGNIKVIFPDTEVPCEDSSATNTRVGPGDYVRVKVRDCLEVIPVMNQMYLALIQYSGEDSYMYDVTVAIVGLSEVLQ